MINPESRSGEFGSIPPPGAENFLSEIEEAHRLALLEQLPEALKVRWHRAPTSKLEELLATREKMGFKKVYGLHVSPNENKTDYIRPGTDGQVHYTTNPLNLYVDKVSKWLYVVEGVASDPWTDTHLGWKASKATLRILERIAMDDEKKKMEILERYHFISPSKEEKAA